MAVHTYQRDKSANEIETIVLEWAYNGDTVVEVLGVELFDHPDSKRSPVLDTMTGPWVVGEANEVYKYLDEQGNTDYAVQYRAGDSYGAQRP